MIGTPPATGWLKAVADAAVVAGVPLPPFQGIGMGGGRAESDRDERFATFKRRLVPVSKAREDGVEWTFWQTDGDEPAPVAAFRDPIDPRPEDVALALTLLKGWLVDGWTHAAAREAVERHPRARAVPRAEETGGGDGVRPGRAGRR